MWGGQIEAAFGCSRLKAKETYEVADWMAQIAAKRSARTTQVAFKLLMQLLDEAVPQELGSRNSLVRIKPPTPKRTQPKVLASEEVERLAETAGPYKAFMIKASKMRLSLHKSQPNSHAGAR